MLNTLNGHVGFLVSRVCVRFSVFVFSSIYPLFLISTYGDSCETFIELYVAITLSIFFQSPVHWRNRRTRWRSPNRNCSPYPPQALVQARHRRTPDRVNQVCFPIHSYRGSAVTHTLLFQALTQSSVVLRHQPASHPTPGSKNPPPLLAM